MRLPFFPITPRPFEGEAFASFLLRLSEANGYHDPYWMVRQLGCSPFVQAREGRIGPIADAANLDEAQLERMRHSPVVGRPNFVRFGPHEVHRFALELRESRYCPDCLAEAGWFPAVWTLKPVAACPKHGTRLLERCPACLSRLPWTRENPLKCACGQDLRQAPTKAAPPAVVALSAAVIGRAQGGCDGDATALPTVFAALSFPDLLEHLMFLAAYASGRGRGGGRHQMARIAGDANAEAITRVAALLEDWPSGFHVLLDDIRRHGGDTSKTGLEAEFRSLYAALYGRRTDPSGYAVIRQEFERYLRLYWDGGFLSSKNRRLGEAAGMDGSFLTLACAARRLDMDEGQLRRDVAEGRIRAVLRQSGSRTLTLIHVDEVQAYRQALARLVGLGDACLVTGLGKKPVLDLVRQGTLRAVRGPTFDGSRHWAFRAEDLSRFVDTLRADRARRRKGDGEIPFCKALRRASGYGLTAPDLVRGVLTGDLPVACVAEHVRGVVALCFRSDEVEVFIRQAIPSVSWGLNLEDAARYLKRNAEAVRDLVAAGLLTTVAGTTNGKAARLVSFDALELFDRTYASAAELAVRLSTSPRGAVAKLASVGISPVTGPTVDGRRQFYFLRKDITPGPSAP